MLQYYTVCVYEHKVRQFLCWSLFKTYKYLTIETTVATSVITLTRFVPTVK